MSKQAGSKEDRIYQKIEEQQFKCALSGIELCPETFELDHIIPMEDGGSDDVENLQAVYPLINRMKGTLSNQQFIDLCEKVADAQKNKVGPLKST